MSSDDIAQQILARIQAQTTEAQERPARVDRWRDEVLATTGRGTAAAGRVVAEVGLQGVLTGLAVSDVVAQRGGRAVGPAVLAAITAAHEDLRAKVDASCLADVGCRHPHDGCPQHRGARRQPARCTTLTTRRPRADAAPKGRGDVNLDPHLFEDTPLAVRRPRPAHGAGAGSLQVARRGRPPHR